MMIRYSQQTIDKQDVKSVVNVLKSKYLTKGKITSNFEKKITKFCNSRYSVSCINASSGLILACKSIGLKKKDIVWTSVNSYIATANCAMHCGASLDFVDIELDNYNIDIEKLKLKLKKTNKKYLPKLIIVVHIAGMPVDMKKVYKLSKQYKFKIIEDASHAFGSKYYNERIGNCRYSDLTVFSFHPVKNITTAEGGAVTTNSKAFYNKMKEIRENGMINVKSKKYPNFYNIKSLGYNFRINEINSALGISQIKKTNYFIKQKKK